MSVKSCKIADRPWSYRLISAANSMDITPARWSKSEDWDDYHHSSNSNCCPSKCESPLLCKSAYSSQATIPTSTRAHMAASKDERSVERALVLHRWKDMSCENRRIIFIADHDKTRWTSCQPCCPNLEPTSANPTNNGRLNSIRTGNLRSWRACLFSSGVWPQKC